ncbi:patatin-like phospholipase family protein [Leifsonia virtsii]|uniref:Patatin-like phospholipase family protein n=1 Tax=Leifsonia virtsii TaxID=3035915 RepID=A0ABT8ITQ0_9MICO|nr:patatin-like phospholipase family protein [Leifsonia virtsii]MDN4596083.1 patatin-like phospholipase family protein [Leifsonia virtsii]
MNTSSSSHDRALVLGGGGSTGNAWLIGVIAGLFEAGVDVTGADLLVGTSAGATAAAQVAGAAPADLYAQALTSVPARPPAPPAPDGRPTGVQRVQAVIDASTDMDDMRRRMSASALELDAASDGAWSDRWRSVVAARLPVQEWPQRRILITAVDARTAEPVVFDRDSGVAIAEAVAASTSSGRPFRIGDERYIDGGYRVNAENADLAAGYERVLVLSPFNGRSLAPASWGTHLAAQVEALRASGSRVEVVGPESEELHGENAMDASLRPAAARAGHARGIAVAPSVAARWS